MGDGADMYSDIVATIALVVSGLTALGGLIVYFRWERPVVHVTGRQSMAGGHGSPTVNAVFTLNIVNTGNQATQIIDAYWEIEIEGKGQTELRPAGSDSALRLERHQFEQMTVTVDVHSITDPSKWKRARPVAIYTSRKKQQTAYGKWEPTQIGQNVAFINSTRPPAGPN